MKSIEAHSPENSPIQKPSFIKMMLDPKDQLLLLEKHSPLMFPLIKIILLIMTFGFIAGYYLSNNQETNTIAEEIGSTPARYQVVSGLISGISSVVGLLFSILIITILYKIALVAIRKDIPFKQIFVIGIYISFIPFIGSIINFVVSIFMGEAEIREFTNFGNSLSSSNMLTGVVSSFDVFKIWNVILYGMLFYYVAKCSKKQSFLISIISFLLLMSLNVAAIYLGNLTSSLEIDLE